MKSLGTLVEEEAGREVASSGGAPRYRPRSLRLRRCRGLSGVGQRGQLLFYKVRFGLEGGVYLEAESPIGSHCAGPRGRDGLHPAALGLGLGGSTLVKVMAPYCAPNTAVRARQQRQKRQRPCAQSTCSQVEGQPGKQTITMSGEPPS